MHVVRTLATGGMETVVRRLVSSLDPERFRQSVCTVVACNPEQPPNTICLARHPDEPSFLVPQLTRLLRRERPDIVHSRNWATIEAPIAAKLAGISGVVHSEHGRDLTTMGRQPWRRRLLRRISYGCADRLFCVSKELREYYCRQLAMNPTSFDVIANGVDVERFRPDPQARLKMRGALGANSQTLVIGTVGRLDPVKDHQTLVRVAEKVRLRGVDLRLVIVGDGSQRPLLEKELADRPDLARCTLLAGEVGNVSEWLNSFDVFVLPSLSEGMSNTLLEAMAVGVAPIATAVGGNREVIEDGHSGLLVLSGAVDQICDALIQLSVSHERRCEFGRNARKRIVSDFSIERMLKQYEEMYCDLMESKSCRLRLSRNRPGSHLQRLGNS